MPIHGRHLYCACNNHQSEEHEGEEYMYLFYDAIDGAYIAETKPSAENMTNGLPPLLNGLRGQRK
jgi:hypothetical protein